MKPLRVSDTAWRWMVKGVLFEVRLTQVRRRRAAFSSWSAKNLRLCSFRLDLEPKQKDIIQADYNFFKDMMIFTFD